MNTKRISHCERSEAIRRSRYEESPLLAVLPHFLLSQESSGDEARKQGGRRGNLIFSWKRGIATSAQDNMAGSQ